MRIQPLLNTVFLCSSYFSASLILVGLAQANPEQTAPRATNLSQASQEQTNLVQPNQAQTNLVQTNLIRTTVARNAGFAQQAVSKFSPIASKQGFSSTQAQTDSEDPLPVLPPQGGVPINLYPTENNLFFSPYTFVVDKSKRTLSVWKTSVSGISSILSLPIDYGRQPGDKFTSGDLRTPEGVYFFKKVRRSPEINFNEYGTMAYTMNYPNFFDRLNSKTGSGIWLHATPDTKSLKRGSRGCLVVRNNEIEGLNQFIQLGRTPIIVTDKVEYATLLTAQDRLGQIRVWLNDWKNNWEQKNIEAYINSYHTDFKTNGMNKDQWKYYKERLNNKYLSIQVKVVEPMFLRHKNQLIIRFLQEYTSDKKSDFGEKTLYLMSKDDQFYIINEVWEKIPQNEYSTALLNNKSRSVGSVQ